MGDNYGYVFEGTSHNFKQKYEIWGGISMFNLVTTQGIHDGEHVETWITSNTNEDATVATVSSTFTCCIPGVITSYAAPNTTLGDGDGIINDSNLLLGHDICEKDADIMQAKVRPFPTYLTITVISPFTFMAFLAIAGGSLAAFDLVWGTLSRVVVGRKMARAAKRKKEADEFEEKRRWAADLELADMTELQASKPKRKSSLSRQDKENSPRMGNLQSPLRHRKGTSKSPQSHLKSAGRVRVRGTP